MKKRGQITHEIYFIMMEVFIALAVAFFLFKYVNLVVEDTTLERTILSRDLALLSNTVYSAPGNLVYTYESRTNLSMFDYAFTKKPPLMEPQLTVLQQGVAELSYPFVLNNLFARDIGKSDKHTVFSPQEILFQKEEQEITVKKELTPHLEGAVCPVLDTKKTNTTTLKVLLDPGKDYENPGANNTALNLIEYKITIDISKEIGRLLQQNFPNIVFTRENTKSNLTERLTKIKLENANITLSIHTGDYQPTKPNTFKMYYNSKSNKKKEIQKLACFISNEISGQTTLKTTTLPLEIETLPDLDSRRILTPTSKIQLYLEVGNIQAYANNNPLLDYPQISNAIKDAIELYHR